MDTASDEGASKVAARENAFAKTNEGENIPLLGNLTSYGNMLLSVELAEPIQTRVVDGLQVSYSEEHVRDLGHKTALFYVLVKTNMPSVLFEAGFLSNSQEERQLRSPHYQNEMAEALASALVEWMERME